MRAIKKPSYGISLMIDEAWGRSYEPKLKRQSNECVVTGYWENQQFGRTAEAVADLFNRWDWEVLYHPPYPLDLSPCDFDLISKTKEPLVEVSSEQFKTFFR